MFNSVADWMTLTCGLAAIAGMAWIAGPYRVKPAQWEFRRIIVGPGNVDDDPHEMGRDGWQLVSAYPLAAGSSATALWLMRRI